ncbi:Uncharacterised protein [Mycobacteroides abscessus subsp. abscessus]|nr:Uncharacterised protein [Mycobacteroides abscessus subsp. abscessus]
MLAEKLLPFMDSSCQSNYSSLLIGVEGTQTPAEGSGRAETPHERSEEEAQRRPAESEVPGTEINSPHL